MKKIGRKIFFDNTNGNVIFEIGEIQGVFIETLIEEDIANFTVLAERVRESFDVIELPFGAFSQDFADCNGYRVNPETQELEFSYPDPNAPQEPQPYQAPLSEEIKTLKEELAVTQEALDFLLMGGM